MTTYQSVSKTGTRTVMTTVPVTENVTQTYCEMVPYTETITVPVSDGCGSTAAGGCGGAVMAAPAVAECGTSGGGRGGFLRGLFAGRKAKGGCGGCN